MQRLAATLSIVAALAGAIAQASLAAIARPQPNTARGAELRVLASPRVFWRWGGSARLLVDPTTRLMRTGTKATCRLRASTSIRTSFLCAVNREGRGIHVLYTVRRTSAFALRRL
jgi:hypothetical protein